jgi:hypothetical protein
MPRSGRDNAGVEFRCHTVPAKNQRVLMRGLGPEGQPAGAWARSGMVWRPAGCLAPSPGP